MVNVEVTKNPGENMLSLLRKFTRRVQGTGIVKNSRTIRYHSRSLSKAVTKKKALKRIKYTANYFKLLKEGKVVETARKFTREEKPNTVRDSVPSKTGLGDATPVAR
ncbi:30S ribosomal protein S21 [bacterium]|nr:30S ribosomal protein S21 [bacterium]